MSGLKIIPTWVVAMDVLIMALENGTEEGKRLARDELKEIGHKLDRLNEQQQRAAVTAEGLQALPPLKSHWDEIEGHPSHEWRAEVANDDTRLGYLDWCAAREINAAADAAEYRGADYGED